jgi:DNA-binding CsgD family transcriptional regulator/tetratricopeptide (TPR) repeat protein
MALVRAGRVVDGMRRLDEASAVCASEQLELPVSVGWALCYLISACEGVGDLPRATQWCEAMRAFTDRWGGRQLLGLCRSAYGRVLATGGAWEAAEVELISAVGDLEASRPAMVAGGLVRLAELRARQGRAEEARELFERAASHRLAVLGLGALALDTGDAVAAADAADRILRRLPEGMVLDRVPALELLVRARIGLGELDRAAERCAELEHLAGELATPYMQGRAQLAAGELAAARGDLEQARCDFEDAIDHLTEAAAVHDAALARLQLARALAELGRTERAQHEARAARDVFAGLGATRDVERAEAPLPDAGPSRGDGSTGELTARELDVLRLVAQGLSDAEIAEQLVLSQHTVHRHVANMRAKLRLPSRAAAVAYAARSGLL